MNHIASTKDKTKLIISDGDVNNALVFTYADDGSILVSVAIAGRRQEQVLYIQSLEAKSAIVDYIIDHIS
jgi:hypothetical protein